jgi:hypothetical protein
MFNGLVGIVFNFPAIVASTSLSWQRAVLIHQFDDCHRASEPGDREPDGCAIAAAEPGPGVPIDATIELVLSLVAAHLVPLW